MIDGDELDILGYIEEFPECENDNIWNAAVLKICKYVDLPPAVDSVPVMRCKDCQNRGTIFCPAVHETMGNGLVDYTSDEAYCWRGRPKDGTNAT